MDRSYLPGIMREALNVRQRCSGILEDGRRYSVYRFCLFKEEFNPYTGESKSITGFYLLPLGIDRGKVSMEGSICKIALASPEICGNNVFPEILEDIVSGITNIFEATDENGNELVVFLDCIGVLGDYPAVCERLGVLGHTVNVIFTI